MNSSSRPDLNIEPFASLGQLHQAAADAFVDLARQTLENRSTFRVSLSGGSTPKRLYELLSERDLPWDKIHWYWGDERNVPRDHRDSNTAMVREALLDRVGVAEANIHPVPIDVDDPAAAALAYEKTLKDHFGSDEFPKWDLALLGMGDDAHTASLFPATNAIDEHSRWFVENWVEKFSSYRYTLTPPAINSANEIWFMVAGSGKREALARVWGEVRDPHRYPSQLIRPTRWFVTADAC